jgi:tRNA (Thr-GGU) A37 N-methylase
MDSITPMTDIANTTMNERNANFEPVNLHPIGVLRSSHRVAEQAPVQPVYARGCAGRAEIIPAYREGLRGPEGFSHGFLFYHLHRAGPAEMTVQPFTGDRPFGVFATRHPRRPNAIGLSLVRLVRTLRKVCCTSKTSMSWTARRCSTSNRSFRVSTASRAPAAAGLKRWTKRLPGSAAKEDFPHKLRN